MKVLYIISLCLFISSCKGSPSEPGKEDPDPDIENFAMGVDLSYLNQILDHNGEYKSEGEARDPYQIFKAKGATTARFRLFNNPDWTKEVYGNDGNQLYNDLFDVERGIKNAQENDLEALLDFHYSDTWADPGAQVVPKAWEGKSFEAVRDSLYQFTYQTLSYLNSKNLLPEMVQIGNETNCGMVFPYGDVCGNASWSEAGELFNAGIKAVRDVEEESGKDIKIILHVAQPENILNWFNNIINEGKVTDFDVVGISYYTPWSDISLNRIGNYVENFAKVFDREVMIMETAYPWTMQSGDNYANIFGSSSLVDGYPATKEGQKQFMIELVSQVLEAGGSGVFYWEPGWITSDMKDRWGQGSAWENNALFDFEGNAHTGFEYMSYDYGD